MNVHVLISHLTVFYIFILKHYATLMLRKVSRKEWN